MAFFKWDDSFDVGVAKLNRQHKRLIRMINALYQASQQSQDSHGKLITSAISELETMASVLDELIDYTQYHFTTEEHLMVEYAYPNYDEHKRAHNQFTMRIRIFKQAFEEGRSLRSTKIMHFLLNWWTEHILDMDKQYGPFFNERSLR